MHPLARSSRRIVPRGNPAFLPLSEKCRNPSALLPVAPPQHLPCSRAFRNSCTFLLFLPRSMRATIGRQVPKLALDENHPGRQENPGFPSFVAVQRGLGTIRLDLWRSPTTRESSSLARLRRYLDTPVRERWGCVPQQRPRVQPVLRDPQRSRIFGSPASLT